MDEEQSWSAKSREIIATAKNLEDIFGNFLSPLDFGS